MKQNSSLEAGQIVEETRTDAVSESTDSGPERLLKISHDIHRAMVSGLRLRLAVAQGERILFEKAAGAHPTNARSPVLWLKLTTVYLLRRLGRRLPGTAVTIERLLKKIWWTVSRDPRTADQLRSSLPFVPKQMADTGQSRDESRPSAKQVDDAKDASSPLAGAPVIEPHNADAPLVSVVIPCFNYGQFVGDAVASVLGQTFRDLEIILVDGGSTDGKTPDQVRALAGPGVKVFCRETPHRVGSNRNFGIERAAGRYICCLDADDRLDPTYIEKAVFILEHYGYDVVSASVEIFGLQSMRYQVAEQVDLEVLLRGNEMATCGLFRRSLWESAGGYRDHGSDSARDHVHEDWEFWVRLAAKGARIFNIQDEHLFQYRFHGSGSLSRREEVRSKDDQRSAILSANADLITTKAINHSVARRTAGHVAVNPLLDLIRKVPNPNDRCIVVILPWMVLGGAERLLSTVLSDLAGRGWRVIIVTTLQPQGADGDTTEWFSAFTSEIFNLPTYLKDKSCWPDFLEYLVASRGARKLLIAGSAFGYERLHHLRARFPELKVYDLLFNTVGHTGSNRRNARHIDRHLVENSEVREWLVRQGENPDRISLVPSGVVIPPADPGAAEEVRATLGISRNDLVVGFSGRWSTEKNPLGFIDIAAELMETPGLHFIMTGIGQMKYDVAEHINATVGLTDRFSLLFDLDDLSNVMHAYDLLVVPSTLDGRPLVVLEALASGVPVIASRIGGIPELIRHRSHGALCDPDRPETFVKEIRRLKNDPEELQRYKGAARAFALTELDAALMVRRFEAALTS